MLILHLLLLLLLTTGTSSTQAILHGGGEADHSSEQCICCLPTPDCLINVAGGGGGNTPTNSTYLPLLFSSLQREAHREVFAVRSGGGALPSYLEGALFKNGFGQFETPQYEFLSVFDAMAYALKIDFFAHNQSVAVTAKMIRSSWYNESMGGDGAIPAQRSFLGTNPPLDFAGNARLLMTSILPDNLNVNLVRQGAHLLAISDMDGFNELDFDTLTFKHYHQYDDYLSYSSSKLWSLLGVLTSAHPVSTAREPHIVYNYVGTPAGLLFSQPVAVLSASPLPGVLLACLAALTARSVFERATGFHSSSRAVTAVLVVVFWGAFVGWLVPALDGATPINVLSIYKLDTTSEPLRREIVAHVPVAGAHTYVHELALTDQSIVLVEWPMTWRMQSILSPLFNDPGKLQLQWQPWLGTRVTVIDKHTGKVRAQLPNVGAYWSYHQIGAYETKDMLVVDACTFDSGEHLHTFELRTLRTNAWRIPPNVNRRFEISLGGKGAKLVAVKNVGPVGFDLPVRNPEYVGRAYKFAYGTGHRRKGEWWNSLVKVDMDTGVTWQWYEEHTWPSQPVFVCDPRRRGEDDGVLVTVMMDGRDGGSSFVLVLDGKTMREVARVPLKGLLLPYTSHGYFDVKSGQSTVPGLHTGFTPPKV